MVIKDCLQAILQECILLANKTRRVHLWATSEAVATQSQSGTDYTSKRFGQHSPDWILYLRGWLFSSGLQNGLGDLRIWTDLRIYSSIDCLHGTGINRNLLQVECGI
jgi:hypothetical protein